MNIFRALFILMMASIIATISIDRCYPVQSDFGKACTEILNGIADGGRCFFLGKRKRGWVAGSLGSDICKELGGQMAQMASVHSEVEYHKIVNYLKKRGNNDPVWVAMCYVKYYIYPKDIRTVDLKNSFPVWYDAQSPTRNLSIGNTWIRYRVCENNHTKLNTKSSYVMRRQDKNINPQFPYCFEDSDQGPPMWYPLCQYTNEAQNFTKTNLCITEMPIQTKTIGTDPNRCAELCGTRGWCRSFNLILQANDGNFTCQFFTWAVTDTCPKCANRTASNRTCVHFTYVP